MAALLVSKKKVIGIIIITGQSHIFLEGGEDSGSKSNAGAGLAGICAHHYIGSDHRHCRVVYSRSTGRTNVQ
jgi:hypothetical protein